MNDDKWDEAATDWAIKASRVINKDWHVEFNKLEDFIKTHSPETWALWTLTEGKE